MGGHPRTILFLTADANGVLPPVARLTPEQAMLWFLMGYTSKLAGTETGIIDPETTFSRFFGEPFMPRNPDVYARMLGEKMHQHGTQVYLVNTGWSGGPFGVGTRMDIDLTRAHRERRSERQAGGHASTSKTRSSTFWCPPRVLASPPRSSTPATRGQTRRPSTRAPGSWHTTLARL